MAVDDRPRNEVPPAPRATKVGPDGSSAQGHGSAHGGYLRSRVLKRSIVVGRHRTSISLEDVFWNELRDIAHRRGVHLSELVGLIDGDRQHCNLSSAIRMFVFEQCRSRTRDEQQQSNAAPEPVARETPGAGLGLPRGR